MDRDQFLVLRDLPGKSIASDIAFVAIPHASPNFIFDQVVVNNTPGWDIVLNGTYKPGIPAITFNFVARGVGPICRIEVNGTIHKEAGRTHKHDLRTPECPRLNLPIAVARLDLVGKTPAEVWRMVCHWANIQHQGTFLDPGGNHA